MFLSIFLFVKLSLEVKQVPYYYEKFLLERYLNHYFFHKSKVINSSDDFQRSHRHLLKMGDNYYVEREYLEKKYLLNYYDFEVFLKQNIKKDNQEKEMKFQ